ncbi:MAG: hypothetical protein OXK72_04710 [Gammaproteobacteria bacterium]|nr:hypothetical protein [Gammaproteobacteria bacterium]MDE0411524.1 hypothetical protein [Gammaproteobacteria bacterium]
MTVFLTWVVEQAAWLIAGVAVSAVMCFLYYRKHKKQMPSDQSRSFQNRSHSKSRPRSPEEIQLAIKKMEKRNEIWDEMSLIIFFLGLVAMGVVVLIVN